MFILRDLLPALQTAFSATPLGRERAQWFVYTLLAVVVPFTSSMTSNLLRTLTTLFGLSVSQRRFYSFMNSLTLPWAQNVVALGLMKPIKGRWACLPLAFRFYLPKKAIEAKARNVKKGGQVVPFQTKLAQAAAMILEIAGHFAGVPVLVVTDSWFGNNGLFKPVREALGLQFHLLSRLRVTSMLYALPSEPTPKQRGAKRKYGQKLGSVASLAGQRRHRAKRYRVQLYGKLREVLAFEEVFMLKTLKCPVRVVWVYRKTQWVALFTTDLALSVEQIIGFYGARWKIGVSGEGHLIQSVEVRPRPKDSSLVAWDAPWRGSKTVKPSENERTLACSNLRGCNVQ